jgi:hypothetical protein
MVNVWETAEAEAVPRWASRSKRTENNGKAQFGKHQWFQTGNRSPRSARRGAIHLDFQDFETR